MSGRLALLLNDHPFKLSFGLGDKSSFFQACIFLSGISSLKIGKQFLSLRQNIYIFNLGQRCPWILPFPTSRYLIFFNVFSLRGLLYPLLFAHLTLIPKIMVHLVSDMPQSIYQVFPFGCNVGFWSSALSKKDIDVSQF